jgi:phosphotransferase system enzyme I (PtsI)
MATKTETNAREIKGPSVSEAEADNGGTRLVLKGIPLVEGYGHGKAFLYDDILTHEMEIRELTAHEVEPERQRMMNAITRVRSDIGRMRRLFGAETGARQAAIFDANEMILADRELLREFDAELMDKRHNAEQVVKSVLGRWEKRFRNAPNAPQQEWASDIADVAIRILRVLVGIEDNVLAHIPRNAVVFTRRLLPSDTVHFVHQKPSGVVTLEGGRYAHSALIARSLHVPLVTGIDPAGVAIEHDDEVIIDGGRGIVIVHPTEDERKKYGALIQASNRSTIRLIHRAVRDFSLLREHGFEVQANASSADEVRRAAKFGCDGIGLYRTESVFLLAGAMPEELEIFERLKDALSAVKNKEIILRLADIGGDKVVPYMDVSREYSSVMGLRGVRFLLKYPSLLKSQMKAFLRLSADLRIKIMVPLVAAPWDMTQTRAVLDESIAELKKEGFECPVPPPVGAMIETPAAYLGFQKILPYVDFVSIGTNDFVQFTMAADRENLALWEYHVYGAELAINALKDIVAQAKQQGIDCSLCGELAADTSYTEPLMAAGLKKFSVEAPLVPVIKEKISSLLGKAKPTPPHPGAARG